MFTRYLFPGRSQPTKGSLLIAKTIKGIVLRRRSLRCSTKGLLLRLSWGLMHRIASRNRRTGRSMHAQKVRMASTSSTIAGPVRR